MKWTCLAAFLLSFPGCIRQGPYVTVQGNGGVHRVRVEVANTEESRTRGLMYRNHLDADAGMLFVFPADGLHQFWMKNTPLPLDLIFIDSDRQVVGIVQQAKPFSTVSRGVDRPSRFVLEVNGGFSQTHGLRTGDRVDFHQIPEAIE